MSNLESSAGQLQSPKSSEKFLAERTEGLPNFRAPVSETEFFEEEKEGLDLLHLWHIIFKRKWTVVTFFLIVSIAGTIASFLETPVYRASLTVNIDRETLALWISKMLVRSILTGIINISKPRNNY
ncbi:MAG: Wzz/FepE/Etk N-terminal domain-containing protein [Candidatus Competibacteraceae bacterium]